MGTPGVVGEKGKRQAEQHANDVDEGGATPCSEASQPAWRGR
jgi:hypothetical protein